MGDGEKIMREREIITKITYVAAAAAEKKGGCPGS